LVSQPPLQVARQDVSMHLFPRGERSERIP
jgi:hypothetical protein